MLGKKELQHVWGRESRALLWLLVVFQEINITQILFKEMKTPRFEESREQRDSFALIENEPTRLQGRWPNTSQLRGCIVRCQEWDGGGKKQCKLKREFEHLINFQSGITPNSLSLRKNKTSNPEGKKMKELPLACVSALQIALHFSSVWSDCFEIYTSF